MLVLFKLLCHLGFSSCSRVRAGSIGLVDDLDQEALALGSRYDWLFVNLGGCFSENLDSGVLFVDHCYGFGLFVFINNSLPSKCLNTKKNQS